MALGANKIIFQLATRPKKFKIKGRKPDPIVFKTSDSELCRVETIKAYLRRSKPWWEENKDTQFFLSFVKPHKAVTSSSIGRWLKLA